MDSRAPIFYYDLGSPECYLVAERISAELAVAPIWEPVLGTWENGPYAAGRRDSRPHLGPHPDRSAIERIARERELQTVRWPSRWPPESELAMRVAVYAKSIGRATAFSLAAFRQAFAAGRELGDLDTLVIAAAACEMHPAAVTKAAGLRSVARTLELANARAVASGIKRLPAVSVGGLVFEGEGGLDEAAAALLAKP